jgi:hypothetical protein
LLQNGLQEIDKPGCIRNQTGIKCRHVWIGVVVNPLLSAATVTD